MDKEIALSELKAICAVISESKGAIPDRYVTPWRGEVGSAFAVVAPENIDQIREVIGFAIKNRFRLLPQGERTGLVGASVPRPTEYDSVIIVSMERYRKKLKYFSAEQRVIADAGFTLSQVNDYLKEFGVHVPINVSSNPMIGGAVATNIGGSRVLKYGDARKLLLGVEVVLADNAKTVYSTLEKPRKDNSSPDFSGVFCGSFGSFGVITAAAFQTYPVISESITAWMSLKKSLEFEDLILKLQEASGDLLIACEFIGKSAMSAICEFEEIRSKMPFAKSDHDLIFVEWGSSHSGIDIETMIEEILGQAFVDEMVDDVAIVPSHVTWGLRHMFSEALRDKGKLIGNDVSVSKDRITEFLAKVDSRVSSFDSELTIRPFGHLGDGGLHVNVIVEGAEKIKTWSEEKSNKVRKIVGEIAVEMGGSFSAEHGLGSYNTELYESLVPKEVKTLNSGFKNLCDPYNVLGHSGIKF